MSLPTLSSSINQNEVDRPKLSVSINTAGPRSSTHTSAIPLPRSSFNRSFSRPLSTKKDSTSLQPPAILGTNRGSLTSIYSQASTAERPASVTSITINRKPQIHSVQPIRTPDLTSVEEEDPLMTPKYHPSSDHHVTNDRVRYDPPTIETPPQDSPDQEDKPLVSPITRSNSQWSRSAVSPEQSVRNTRICRTDTIKALTRAISSTVADTTTSAAVLSPSNSYGAPGLPMDSSSVTTSAPRDLTTLEGAAKTDPMATMPLYEPYSAAEYRVEQEQSPTETRSLSTRSTHPLLESPLEKSAGSINDRRRPPYLMLQSVKDRESRSSLTSLPDLIKRATRLASNLDRGKTASRLGLDAMFSNTDKANAQKRESTYSEVLFSFPAPAVRTTSSLGHEKRPATMLSEDQELTHSISRSVDVPDTYNLVEDDDISEKVRDVTKTTKKRRSRHNSQRTRRCCGLPLMVFLVFLGFAIVLIAAAILLPIFLIWWPKRHERSYAAPTGCSATFKCQNGGISILDNNACACICVDGFTGSRCTVGRDPSCITTTIQADTEKYDNATVGSNIMPLLSIAASRYNIPLNATALLSIFAHNNLSCSAENSLVRFSTDPTLAERFVMLPGLEPEIYSDPVPTKVVANDATKRSPQTPPAETINDIVYAASSTATAAAPSTTIVTATTTSASAAATSSATIKLTSGQIDFAQIVVLYVLQQSRDPSVAVNSQQTLNQYLKSGGPNSGNTTVTVVPYDDSSIVANFGNFTVTNTNQNGGSAGSA